MYQVSLNKKLLKNGQNQEIIFAFL